MPVQAVFGLPKIRKSGSRELVTGLIMIMPFLILAGLFFFAPLVEGIIISTYKIGLPEDKFIGFDNYSRMLKDRNFHKTLINSIVFGLYTIAGVWLSLFLAVYLGSRIVSSGSRFKRIVQSCVALPFLTSWVVLGLAWNWVMVVGAGAEFAGLSLTGKVSVTGGSVSPLADPNLSLHTCGLIFIWAGLGYNALILLAGINSIPKDLYEAAQIDGADSTATFRYITVPLLRPILTFLTISAFIWPFQQGAFEAVAALTYGGSGWAASNTVFYMARQAIMGLDFGYASAIGITTALIVLTISFIQYRLLYGRLA